MNRSPLVIIAFCLSACSILSPVEDDPVRHLLEASVPSKATTSSRPAVAVARPSLPPYLERAELVTRSGKGTLKVHENDLWSEPLDEGITRVVADNLRRLTGSPNIQPSDNFISRDYTALVEIRIERFDPLPDGNMVLECTWKAQPIGGGDAEVRTFRATVPMIEAPSEAINTGMRGRIVAMNEALAQLSGRIAKSL